MPKIPVYTSEGFQRFATGRQGAAEIAGRVLGRREGHWRTAEKRWSPVVGEYWLAFHYLPKDDQVRDWQHRPMDKTRKVAQVGLAHG